MSTTSIMTAIDGRPGGIAGIRLAIIAGIIAPVMAFSLFGCSGSVFSSLPVKKSSLYTMIMALMNGSAPIDSTAAAPSVPDLAAADDTGASNTDNITSQATALTFSGTSENNASIEIFNGTTSLGTTTADGSGNWSIDLDLAAGTYAINAVQTDTTGNVSAASGNLSLAIDTGTTPPSLPGFDSADDTGTSNSDRITSRTTGLTFSGTAESNALVEIFNGVTSLGTTAADASGNWSVDLDLPAGTYAINAAQTDAAGNVSAASGNLSLTIDGSIAAPSAPDLASADDTGASNSDNVTSQTTGLTFSGTAEDNASVEIFNGVASLGTTTADGSGNWTIDIDLSAGTHAINAIQTDTAGNVSSASGSLAVIISSSVPAPSIPDLASADDTGSSNSDNITSRTTGLTFSGTSENNASIELFDGVTSLGTTTADESGNWSIDLNLPAGTYSINGKQTDTAGNLSFPSGSLSLTVDTGAAAPAVPDLVAADDTGASNSDNNTSQTTGLTFTGTAENNASIEIFNGVASLGTTTADGFGTWTIDLNLLAGTYSINAKQTDTAGNMSAASANLTVTVDTGTSAPSAPDLDPADDTGSSNSDNNTSQITGLTFTGTAENNASIELFNGAASLSTTTANGSGNWTIDLDLSAGSYTIHAIQTDPAGNVSTASGTLSLTVDTTKPAVSIGSPSDTLINSGGSATFTLTYEFAPSPDLTGTDIIINESGVSCSSVTITDAGTITPDVTVSGCTGDGSFTISVASAQSADTAGNTDNGAGPSGTVNVDNTVPTVTIGTPTVSYVNSSGTVDYPITYEGATAINLTAAEVAVNTTGGASCVKSVLNGNMAAPTVRLTGCSGNGTADIDIVAGASSDAAGNTDAGDDSSNLFYVDNTNPDISSIAPASSATVNSTLVSYTLSEICASGSITWARTGGSADGDHAQSLAGSELNAGSHNNITITNNPTLVDGAIYTITWACTDRAGNSGSEASTGVTFTNTALAVAGAETMDTDNDGKIDTYRVAFNKNVDDSTFPGYIENSPGSVTNDWLVAGYTNVRLIHGSAVTFATDTADDAVIYIRFDESLTSCSASDQAGCDTGAKPDLTTTAAPALKDLGSNALAQIGSSDVTESDGAKPLLITARSLNANAADVIFSEAMEETTAENALYYAINNGITVTGATRDDGNNKVVHLATSALTGGTAYTLTVNTDVKDMANLSLDPSANTINFTGVVRPIVVSIETENSTTLTITFNEAVTAASAECANLTACSAVYSNASLPVKAAVSTAGSGNNSATYTLTVNPMVEGQNYTASVLENTVTSAASGQKMGSENNSATFIGDGNPGAYISTDTATECPTPSNLPPVSAAQTRVIVQYDQAVTATALTTANYRIILCLANAPCSTGTGSPNSVGAGAVTAMGGNKYAVDFTDPFDSDSSEYQMNISNVADANGNTVTAPMNLGFRCGTDATPPSLIRANVVTANASTTQVMLTFSESVDQVTANASTSYKYDSAAYGSGVYSAARQSNYAQVLVTFAPGLAVGGHQIRVQNVQDLATTPNTILDNAINNVQPIIVTAPDSLDEGEVFQDPFNDGTKAALIVRYDSRLYLGTDSTSAKLFEVDYGLTTSQLILIDADGVAGAPVQDFNGYTTVYSNSGTFNTDKTLKGVDTLYAACVGGSSTPEMTGSACTAAGGTETLFIGGLNISGMYKSFWYTNDKSTSTTTFTFTEEENPDTGGAYAFRSTVFVLFKDQLWNHFGAEGGGGGRGGRVCMKAGGCSDGTSYLNGVALSNISRVKRIGASNTNSLRNGSYNNNTFSGQVSSETYVLNAINTLYEHDNDGTGANESQLYMANGGFYTGSLGSARTGSSDGGIVRTILTRSSRSSLPGDCGNDSDGCTEYWEDVTPDSNSDWNSFMSIMLPQNSNVSGSANCSSSSIEMDCSQPYNLFVPAMKAIPYMRTAPNGDLYMIRNACSTTTVCLNGKADCDFRTVRQTCPTGSEVPQLWMMPKNCGSASSCASSWVLVAEYGATGKTNMAGNTGDCGTSPNKCTANTHATLLEFVGNYLYVGFDNATHGANIWRTDMSGVSSGSTPAESSFEMVNITGLDGTATNQKLFSHITINESGTDWLILTTRDGNDSVQIYRTGNNQN